MLKRDVTLLFLFAKPPFFVGVYENNILIDSVHVGDGKASDVLPLLVGKLLKQYSPAGLIYANGPGNQMSIKICFVCLKTLSILKNIPLRAACTFEFCDKKPIELTNKRFFCLENDKITLEFLPDCVDAALRLPDTLGGIVFSDLIEPLYVLPPA